MEVSMLDQLLVFFASILIGAVLGIIYDAIRGIRAVFGIQYKTKFGDRLKNLKFPIIKNPLNRKKSRIADGISLFITDIIYFVLATFVLVIFIYYINDGIVRWYIFAGAIVGMLAYYFSVGRLFISIIELILFFIRVMLAYFFHFLFLPFACLIRTIRAKLPRLFARVWHGLGRKRKPKNEPIKRQELMKSGKV